MTAYRFARAAVLAAAALLAASGARAQIAVFDAGNYAQNVLSAARALEQIEHQLTSLQNQALMLQNQARNLQPLGVSALEALRADTGQVNALLADAGRIANEVSAVRAEFERNYAASGSDAELAASADARWRNSLDGFRHVLEVQATVAQTVSATQAQAAEVAAASQDATGALQAAQAGNQLLAVQSKQLADLTALLAASSRAEAIDAAGRAAAAAEGRVRLQRFLGKAP